MILHAYIDVTVERSQHVNNSHFKPASFTNLTMPYAKRGRFQGFRSGYDRSPYGFRGFGARPYGFSPRAGIYQLPMVPGSGPSFTGFNPVTAHQGSGYPRQPQAKDTVNNDVAVNTTGQFILLNGCTPGDLIDSRHGQHIKMLTNLIKFDCFPDTTVPQSQVIRCMLIWDRQSNAAAPTVTDVLKTATVESMINLDGAWRFKILKDQNVNLQVLAGAGNGTTDNFHVQIKHYKWFTRLGLPTVFNAGTAGNEADIESGALYFLALGSNAAGSSDVVMNVNSRTRFWG